MTHNIIWETEQKGRLIGFYDISTLVCYLIHNLIYTYTLNIWFVNELIVNNIIFKWVRFHLFVFN